MRIPRNERLLPARRPLPVREITIFEASGEFGPGYAYRPSECRDYLINNTTSLGRRRCDKLPLPSFG
jgi:hypothetical protein